MLAASYPDHVSYQSGVRCVRSDLLSASYLLPAPETAGLWLEILSQMLSPRPPVSELFASFSGFLFMFRKQPQDTIPWDWDLGEEVQWKGHHPQNEHPKRRYEPNWAAGLVQNRGSYYFLFVFQDVSMVEWDDPATACSKHVRAGIETPNSCVKAETQA